jgi:long-chain acyl-CoA synthetase
MTALPVPPFPSVVHALAAAAREAPERIALVAGSVTLSYAAYEAAVAATARRLKPLGAGGARVATLLPNTGEAAVTLLAALAAGAELAPMNPNYTDAELRPLLADVAPALIVVAAEIAPRVRALAAPGTRVVVLGTGTAGAAVADALDPLAPGDGRGLTADLLPAPESPAVMFFTGGTTGLPKGARHPHVNLMWHHHVTMHPSAWPLPSGARMLNVAPLFHIWGFCFTLVDPVCLAATTVLLPAYSPAAVLAAFRRHRIEIFAGGPPTMYVGLRAHPDYRTMDWSHLKYGLSGGAPCPAELVRAWEAETGSILLEGVGMSEGAPYASNPMHGVRKPLSVGLVPALTTVEIVDVETGARRLPPGARGEIRVKGPHFTREYCNRPDETAKTIRGGWLYTGDIGYFDADGYLFVVDRKKEMILVGGYNVYPREVDEVLHDHPAVLEAATVGVPDAFSGEAVKAFVALKPGATLDRAALDAHCAERLVKYKRPTHVEFVDRLPKTGVGKIDKLALKGKRR